MKKYLLFILCNILFSMLLIGCNVQDISDNMKDNGFEIISDSQQLDKDVQGWVNEKESSTGIYKMKSLSGNYLLISLGNHKQYTVTKIDVEKDNSGYLFNVTITETNPESLQDGNLLSPILVKTDHPSENYDIKIIYN